MEEAPILAVSGTPRAFCPAGSPVGGWVYSTLEPELPAGARLSLATAGNHVALIWGLVWVFCLGRKEGKR